VSNKSLWIIAIVLTLVSAIYQRMTGPTHPVRLNDSIGGIEVQAKLLRSHSTNSDMVVSIDVSDTEASADLRWRRWPTDEPWIDVPMEREGGSLIASIPAQPSAGKVEYVIQLEKGRDVWRLTGEEAVVARFKGDVSLFFLIPHVLAMFLAMLWANRAGLEALTGGRGLAHQVRITLGLLVVGGLVFGPIIQKYAFGAYWTGWPFGQDLTDNKLAVAVLAWILAALMVNGRRITARARVFTVIAALVILGVYMIPHSMNGSTLDYTSGDTISR